MSDTERETPETGENGYMEELSKAYAEAFRKRLAGKSRSLSEEKRTAIGEMQSELSRAAGRIALGMADSEKKELARMLKESAEEMLSLLETDEIAFVADPERTPPLSATLVHATMLANRSLNLLIRHTQADERLMFLVLSELSALYALAAIN